MTTPENTRHPVDLHVGQRIRDARIVRGVSQDELGQRIGITFQQIQKYEKGANRVSASKLWDIAKALSVEPAYFFGGYDETTTVEPIVRGRRGMELVRNFEQIPEAHAQQAVFNLTKALAKAPLRAEDQPVAAE